MISRQLGEQAFSLGGSGKMPVLQVKGPSEKSAAAALNFNPKPKT